MTEVFYDTEFIEDGRTIDLISIGLVDSKGREYYAINRQMPVHRIDSHEWLMANVIPHLPQNKDGILGLDWENPLFKTRDQIASEVLEFLQRDQTEEPELWAWYGAYDHVALARLWGPMSAMPEGLPFWTNDLRQVVHTMGLELSELPPQPKGQHNALEDARWNRRLYEHLQGVKLTSKLEVVGALTEFLKKM